MPKVKGGLSIIIFKIMNQALLAKWIWKWLHDDHSL
jgi:hypothetical protein